jgi:hypothetical protein
VASDLRFERQNRCSALESFPALKLERVHEASHHRPQPAGQRTHGVHDNVGLGKASSFARTRGGCVSHANCLEGRSAPFRRNSGACGNSSSAASRCQGIYSYVSHSRRPCQPSHAAEKLRRFCHTADKLVGITHP